MSTRAAAPAAVEWADPARRLAFEAWLASLPAERLQPASLRPASADASFRRYLRVDTADGASRIVMDAPPPQEDVRPFVQIAQLIGQAGLNAPRVLAQDVAHGFLLLTDLGTEPYLATLQQALAAGDTRRADGLMREAFGALVQWQQRVDARALPVYDDALLRRELALFPDWCVAREYGIEWTAGQQTQWREACDKLVASALAQPRVAVHRDYMPRNLMVADPNPGILDFQDAVLGPITYDAASMLRDAFISWDEEQELDWAVRYWQQARAAGLPLDPDFGEFWRQLEWMGMQRHLKVLGIFCRLKHRDGKPGYSQDLPRFFAYVRRVARRYQGFGPLLRLVDAVEGVEAKVGYTF
ncbi:MAG: phosphotransferase [Piscinibacter sp.]|nr:phosphotransferase [Piscinibacter sp.]